MIGLDVQRIDAERFGYAAKVTAPAELATFFAAEMRKWPPILRAAGLKPQ